MVVTPRRAAETCPRQTALTADIGR